MCVPVASSVAHARLPSPALTLATAVIQTTPKRAAGTSFEHSEPWIHGCVVTTCTQPQQHARAQVRAPYRHDKQHLKAHPKCPALLRDIGRTRRARCLVGIHASGAHLLAPEGGHVYGGRDGGTTSCHCCVATNMLQLRVSSLGQYQLRSTASCTHRQPQQASMRTSLPQSAANTGWEVPARTCG